MNGHRRQLEATNAGHYFSDCSCGWSGGVHRSRALAASAHKAHVEGGPLLPPVRTIFLEGPRIQGQAEVK